VRWGGGGQSDRRGGLVGSGADAERDARWGRVRYGSLVESTEAVVDEVKSSVNPFALDRSNKTKKQGWTLILLRQRTNRVQFGKKKATNRMLNLLLHG